MKCSPCRWELKVRPAADTVEDLSQHVREKCFLAIRDKLGLVLLFFFFFQGFPAQSSSPGAAQAKRAGQSWCTHTLSSRMTSSSYFYFMISLVLLITLWQTVSSPLLPHMSCSLSCHTGLIAHGEMTQSKCIYLFFIFFFYLSLVFGIWWASFLLVSTM